MEHYELKKDILYAIRKSRKNLHDLYYDFSDRVSYNVYPNIIDSMAEEGFISLNEEKSRATIKAKGESLLESGSEAAWSESQVSFKRRRAQKEGIAVTAILGLIVSVVHLIHTFSSSSPPSYLYETSTIKASQEAILFADSLRRAELDTLLRLDTTTEKAF